MDRLNRFIELRIVSHSAIATSKLVAHHWIAAHLVASHLVTSHSVASHLVASHLVVPHLGAAPRPHIHISISSVLGHLTLRSHHFSSIVPGVASCGLL